MCTSSLSTVYAQNTTENVSNNIISISQENSNNKEILESSGTYNELDMIIDLKKYSENELKSLGFDKNGIEEIKNGKAEESLKQELLRRSKLSYNELNNMGYPDKDIKELKSLTGEEDIYELRGLFANVDCRQNVSGHTYSSSTNTTTFDVSFSWMWDKMPSSTFKDTVGIGWNNNFQIKSSSHQVFYKNTGSGKVVHNSIGRFVEKDFYVGSNSFDLLYSKGIDLYKNYAYYGIGSVTLTQKGKADNAKFTFKYAHNKVGLVPSVSIPIGVSFSFTNSPSIYTPNSILNSTL